MPYPSASSTVARARLTAALAIGAFLICLFIVSQGRFPVPQRFASLVLILIQSGFVVSIWLLAAMGYGWAAGRALLGEAHRSLVTQAALGVGAMLLIDWCLAWAGWLNEWGAWGGATVGWLLLLEQARLKWKAVSRPETWPMLPWPALLGVPAVALLLGACTIAPGTLWRSEFGAYDVLSYHLQLPREWMELGRMTGLEHNAYSYLPNLMEAGYMHLGVWFESMLGGAYAAQLLHASMAILAAVGIGRLASLLVGPHAGAAAGAIYLAVPWTIVTGSLAYNEQAVVALGAAALRLAMQSGGWLDAGRGEATYPARLAAAAGLLCGAAALVKLTSAGFVAMPVLIALFGRPSDWRLRIRQVAGRAGVFIAAAAIVVALWMARNAVWTGNPTFPLGTNVFGTAHWSAEQAVRWNTAHSSHLPLTQRFAELWWHGMVNRFESITSGGAKWQVTFGGQYGYVLWPAALIGAALGIVNRATRLVTILLIILAAAQVVFWLLFTHLQSRFLVPVTMPACILCAIGMSRIHPPSTANLAIGGVAAVLTIYSYGLYLTERGGRAADFIDGVISYVTQLDPNATYNALPPGSRIYAEGFATPFYVQTPITYHTVWDRSPLGEAMRRGSVEDAIQWLRQAGYTHLLIDHTMINVWTQPGNYGYDPNVTRELLDVLTDRLPPPIGRMRSGQMLYPLQIPAPPDR